MVADHVQERLVTNELPCAVDGVTVPPRPILWDESYRTGECPGGLRIPRLITRPHHNTNLPYIRGKCLLDEDGENGFLNSVVD
jgi:hypothetical protein